MANCIVELYATLAAWHTACELVDDAKFLATFVAHEGSKETYVLVKKT